MSRSSDYWAKREAAHAEEVKKREAKYSSQISDIYLRMYNSIQAQIDTWYAKYAKDEKISMAEARKRVAQADIKALASKAKKYVKDKDFSDRANEEMKLYNLTMKVNRLEYLKSDIGIEMTKSYSEVEKFLGDTLTDEAREEYIRQAGILGESVDRKNLPKNAKNVAYGSFQNANFSDRIWQHQEALHAELSRKLSAAIIQGKSAKSLATDLKKTFGVSQANAERLMVTEIARVQTDVAKDSMERNHNEYYEFLATGPHPCEICKKLDGKRFKVEDMEPGVNAPPMHPYCVLPDTKIIAPDMEAMTKSYYSGNVVQMFLANGTRLSVTPNHIVLTSRGWVRAKNLMKGDKVIYYSRWGKAGVHGDPTDDNGVPMVKDLFASLIEASGGTSCRVPASSVDLKGDVVPQTEIDVVFVDSKLRDKLDPSTSKFISDVLLVEAGESGELSLNGECSLAKVLVTFGLAADGLMGRFSNGQLLRLSSMSKSELLSFRTPSDYDMRLLQDSANDTTRNTILLGKSILRSPRGIGRNDCANGTGIKMNGASGQRNAGFMENVGNKVLANMKRVSDRYDTCSGIEHFNDGRPVDTADLVSQVNTTLPKNGPDCVAVNTIAISDVVDSYSTCMEFDDIVDVRIKYFSGHVYDASCISTLYIANGVITSNCHCSTAPAWDEEKYTAWMDSGAAKKGISYDAFDPSTYKARKKSK